MEGDLKDSAVKIHTRDATSSCQSSHISFNPDVKPGKRKSFLETGIVFTLFIPLLKLIKSFQVDLLATTLSSTEFD
jgi:hypothetical protein